MRLSWRPPLFVFAVALLGLLLLLATLQYVWLGRISEAERERLRSTLTSRASEFAQDFDRELTRAYLLFQTDGPLHAEDPAARFAERYDRWQGTSAFPQLVGGFYVVSRGASGQFELRQFDPATRRLNAVEWPPSMADWRTRLQDHAERPSGSAESLVIRRIAAPIWETIPALVVPAPMLFLSDRRGERPPMFSPPELSYTLLTIDLNYVRTDLLPALAQRHFRKPGEASDYQIAVVDSGGPQPIVYQSTAAFTPHGAERGDAHAPLFQVRTQDFSAVAAEVRRFTFNTAVSKLHRQVTANEGRGGPVPGPPRSQMSIVVQQRVGDGAGRGELPAAVRVAAPSPRWQVIVKHPAGSLEAFVGSTRRRNLIVSSSILVVLGASMALLIVSTRRSQELVRQQLEFVAAVSHELRTPLAVIRSAGENLADGVVADGPQVRQYGELVRAEGRRLSEMVEQILELAGIQSGQRGFARRPVPLAPLVVEVLARLQSLVERARIQCEVDIPGDLPPISGDEAAIARVLQNLIGNAIKYGAAGGWVGIRARASGGHVVISVRDKGIGIAGPDHPRIFEPFFRSADVIAARIQGAGLGLSLVQRIVDGHGGTVTVTSAPGAGSEFVVSLPAATGAAAGAVTGAPASAEAARTS